MSAELPLSMPTVPEGFCNSLNDSDWVQNLMNLIAQGVAILDGTGFTVLINSTTQPGVTDRDKLWRDPDTGLIYQFLGGAWVTPHPESPSGLARRWFAGTLIQLQTYDGGDTNPVGDNSGPMWEEDTDFQGRVPIHPGAIPTSTPAQNAVVNTNIGQGTKAITEQNIPEHSFFTAKDSGNATGAPYANADDSIAYQGGGMGNENYNLLSVTPAAGHVANVGPTNNYGQATPDEINLVQPSRGLYCIKRTARVNYVGS